MPISNTRDLKKSLTESSARLAPIYKQLEKEVFGVDKASPFIFFGPAVRESLIGGTFDEIDVELPFNSSNFFRAAAIFTLRGSMRATRDDAADSRFAGQFEIISQLGVKYKINVWFIRPISRWSCDDVAFCIGSDDKPKHNGPHKIPSFNTYTSNISIENYDDINAENVVDYLKSGADLTAKYGWQMAQQTLNKLNGIIEASKPLEMYYETIIGFRSYKIGSDGYLYGFHSARWDTAELVVDCEDFRQHIKVSESTVGGSVATSDNSEGHGCGIYLYKSLMECLINYKGDAIALVVANGGDFWEGERGFRVEKARIEKLWVFRGSNPLRTHYEINGGVVVDCSRDEAVRDILAAGISIDSERSLL